MPITGHSTDEDLVDDKHLPDPQTELAVILE